MCSNPGLWSMKLCIPYFILQNYILTYDKDSNPLKDDFALHFDRAKKQGIETYLLESDHNPQWSAPEEFSKLIIDLK